MKNNFYRTSKDAAEYKVIGELAAQLAAEHRNGKSYQELISQRIIGCPDDVENNLKRGAQLYYDTYCRLDDGADVIDIIQEKQQKWSDKERYQYDCNLLVAIAAAFEGDLENDKLNAAIDEYRNCLNNIKSLSNEECQSDISEMETLIAEYSKYVVAFMVSRPLENDVLNQLSTRSADAIEALVLDNKEAVESMAASIYIMSVEGTIDVNIDNDLVHAEAIGACAAAAVETNAALMVGDSEEVTRILQKIGTAIIATIITLGVGIVVMLSLIGLHLPGFIISILTFLTMYCTAKSIVNGTDYKKLLAAKNSLVENTVINVNKARIFVADWIEDTLAPKLRELVNTYIIPMVEKIKGKLVELAEKEDENQAVVTEEAEVTDADIKVNSLKDNTLLTVN